MQVFDRADQVFPDIFERTIRLSRLGWRFGHITSLDTLVFLCCLARAGYTDIFEFGTFTGRTTFNLAMNASGTIYTCDSGIDDDRAANAFDEPYQPYVIGEAFQSMLIATRIRQLLGDSRVLDFSHLEKSMGLVFIDGGHSYDVVKSDSVNAFKMLRPGGVIVWDDYNVDWPGAMQAIDELDTPENNLMFFRREGVVVSARPRLRSVAVRSSQVRDMRERQQRVDHDDDKHHDDENVDDLRDRRRQRQHAQNNRDQVIHQTQDQQQNDETNEGFNHNPGNAPLQRKFPEGHP